MSGKRELVAFVTTSPGSEEKAKSELEDLFARFKVDAEVVKTGIAGNLLIYSASPKGYLGLVLRKNRPAYSESVVLIDVVCKADAAALAKCALSLVQAAMRKKKLSSFRVKSRVRGSPLGEHDLEVTIGKSIKDNTGLAVSLESPDATVYVYVIGEVAGVTVA